MVRILPLIVATTVAGCGGGADDDSAGGTAGAGGRAAGAGGTTASGGSSGQLGSGGSGGGGEPVPQTCGALEARISIDGMVFSTPLVQAATVGSANNNNSHWALGAHLGE